MFATSIAGSLPKPAWLAQTGKLWPEWRQSGAELDDAKADATRLAVAMQQDAGIDVVTDGEQARQHFVHGFLERVDGIDRANEQAAKQHGLTPRARVVAMANMGDSPELMLNAPVPAAKPC